MPKARNPYAGDFFIAGLYGSGSAVVSALGFAGVITFTPMIITLIATSAAVALLFLASVAQKRFFSGHCHRLAKPLG